MSEKYKLELPEIPKEKHKQLWAAQDAYDERLAHIERLKNAKAGLEAEIVTMKAEREKAKADYVNAYGDIKDGAEKFPKKGKDASTRMAELAAKIAGHEDALSDYGNQIESANWSLRELAGKVDQAKMEIRGALLKTLPRLGDNGHKSTHSIAEFVQNGDVIDLLPFIMLSIAHEDGNVPNAFGADGIYAKRLFDLICYHFKAPSSEELQTFKARYEALIWGDRDPAPKIRVDHLPINPPGSIDFNSMQYS